MWHALTQLPSLISACLDHLRLLGWVQQQSLLLQQEQNLLLRELIVKVTTQPAHTPEAIEIPRPSFDPAWTRPLTADSPPPLPSTATSPPRPPAASPGPGAPHSQRRLLHRVLTDKDIIRNTRSTIAQTQFEEAARRLHPHRDAEILPPSPAGSPALPPLPPPIGPLP